MDSTIPTLPQEITDRIVDEFSLTATTTELKALSWVSRAFNFACSRHIFCTVILKSTKTSDFLCFLRSSTRIALYVRDMRIIEDISQADVETSLPGLSSILRSLNLLHSFTLSFSTHVGWSSFNGETRAAFVYVLSLPSLQSVTLRGLQQFPPSLITLFLPLNRLELTEVCIKGHDSTLSPAIPGYVAFSNLRSLSLGGASSSSARALIDALGGRSVDLKKLIISPTCRDNLAAMGWHIASIYAATLTHIEWRPSADWPSLGAAIHFNTPHFANLRDLTFLADLQNHQPFVDLIFLLRRVASNNIIKNIIIECLPSASVNISTEGWQNLDNALSDDRYRHLECVQFMSRDRKQLGPEVISERLPVTRAKGVVLSLLIQPV